MLCFVYAKANDIIPRRVYATSLKQLIGIVGDKLGIYSYNFDIDSSVSDIVSFSNENDRCCATAYSDITRTKCSIINKGGWYIVWSNYENYCCPSGRLEWSKVKDLLLPHERKHKAINIDFNENYAPETKKALNSTYAKECSDTYEKAKKDAVENCDKKLATIMDDFIMLCRTSHAIQDKKDVKSVNGNVCTCN